MQQATFAKKDKQDFSLPIDRVGGSSLLLGLLPTLPFIVVFWAGWGWRIAVNNFNPLLSNVGFFWLAMVGGIVVHEFLHGFTWAIAGPKSWQTVEFGIQWKTLTPYAHSTQPMPAWAYRLGVAMPALLLGFAPMLAGLAIANGWLFLFGIIFTIAAGGDFLVLWLLRQVDGRQLVADHPKNVGCLVYVD